MKKIHIMVFGVGNIGQWLFYQLCIYQTDDGYKSGNDSIAGRVRFRKT